MMKDLTLKHERFFGFEEKRGSSSQDIQKSEGFLRWKLLFEELRAGVNAPFESDWEKKAGSYWKDWGKL